MNVICARCLALIDALDVDDLADFLVDLQERADGSWDEDGSGTEDTEMEEDVEEETSCRSNSKDKSGSTTKTTTTHTS